MIDLTNHDGPEPDDRGWDRSDREALKVPVVSRIALRGGVLEITRLLETYDADGRLLAVEPAKTIAINIAQEC